MRPRLPASMSSLALRTSSWNRNLNAVNSRRLRSFAVRDISSASAPRSPAASRTTRDPGIQQVDGDVAVGRRHGAQADRVRDSSLASMLRVRPIRPSADFARESVRPDRSMCRRSRRAQRGDRTCTSPDASGPSGRTRRSPTRTLRADAARRRRRFGAGASDGCAAAAATACEAEGFFTARQTTAATCSTYSRSRLSSIGIVMTCFRRSSATGQSPSLYS